MIAPALAGGQAGLWSSVWKLLRLRLTIALSGFRRARTRRKIGMIFVGLLLLFVLGFILFVSWALLKGLRSPQLAEIFGDTAILLEGVPVLVVAGAFLGILVTSFGLLLQALYLAGDMDFLLAAPVPIRAVFIAKLLQAILPNFGLICLFAVPVLFGLGISGGYNLLYYPLVLVVLAALALAAAGLSSLLVMGVVRIFPARRVAEVLGFLGATLSFLCSQSGNLARFDRVDQGQAAEALRAVSRLNTPWSPLAWAGRGLVDLGEGRWASAGIFLFLSLGLAALAFGGALATAERLYYNGWASMQGNKRKKKAPASQARAAGAGEKPSALGRMLAGSLPRSVQAIVRKDYWMLRRDLRSMSQLVTPLIFGLVYAFMFLRSGGQAPAGRGEAPEWFMLALQNVYVYGNVGIALFVSWMLESRLAGMGFSQEGKGYWMLKTAPVSSGKLLSAKYLVAFIPSTLLALAFLLAISLVQRVDIGTLLYSLAAVTLTIAGNTGVNLAFGVLGARLDWEDPRQMQRGGMGCLGALAVMLAFVVAMALFFGPPLLFSLIGWPEAAGQALGLLAGGLFSLACAYIPPWWVRGRVDRLGEE